MKKQHEFGGDWTQEKLGRVRRYLQAYTKIFSKHPRAQKLATIYVDVFAGTGHRTRSSQSGGETGRLKGFLEPEVEEFFKGSARIALEVVPPFDRYVFIEQDPDRMEGLRQLRTEFPDKGPAIEIVQAEANAWLTQWCNDTDWRRCRAVVFLDPYGRQVDWTLIEALTKTRAVDLWILVPLGVAVNRLLPRSGEPPPKWAEALTRCFGTESWRDEFYAHKQAQTLFGEKTVVEREADFEKIGAFFVERLKTVFAAVGENPLQLRNARNLPLYLSCFAASNPKGASTALRIALHISKSAGWPAARKSNGRRRRGTQ